MTDHHKGGFAAFTKVTKAVIADLSPTPHLVPQDAKPEQEWAILFAGASLHRQDYLPELRTGEL
jgi:hypothetical protein